MSEKTSGNGFPLWPPSDSQLYQACRFIRAGGLSKLTERDEPADELFEVASFVVQELALGAKNTSHSAEDRHLAAYQLGKLIKDAAEGLSESVPQLATDGRQEAAMGYFRGLIAAVRAFNSSARTTPEFYHLALVYGVWPCLASLSGSLDAEGHIEQMQRFVLRQILRRGRGRKADFGGFAMRQVLYDRLALEKRAARMTWLAIRTALCSRKAMIETDPGFAPYLKRKRAKEEKDGAWISFLGDAQQAFETLSGGRRRRSR